MANKKSNFYLTKEELNKEIIASKKRFRESNYPKTPAECFTPKLTEYLMLMVNRYANKGQWRGYSYIEDMKSDALKTLCENAFKFNEEKYDNPFGYYTQIIKYCFITSLEKEELVRDIKDSLWEQQGMTPSFARQIKNTILDHAREAMLERAKERGVKEQANKTIKALKKDVEVLSEKINRLASVIKILTNETKKTKIGHNGGPPLEVIIREDTDHEIADVLEIDILPYTGDISSTMSLFIKTPTYQIERDIEIAGQRVHCLTLLDESTNSRTKRVIPDTDESTISATLCSLALTIRRDLLVKELRDISGHNITSTRMPTADKMTVTDGDSFESEPSSTGGYGSGELNPSPKRRPPPRRKPIE